MKYDLFFKYYISIFFSLWVISSFIFINFSFISYVPFIFSLAAFFLLFISPKFYIGNNSSNIFFFLNFLLFFWIFISCLNSDLKILSLQRIIINYLPILSLVLFFYLFNPDFIFFKKFFNNIKNFVLISCIFSFILLNLGSIVWDSEQGYLNYLNQLPFFYQRVMGDYPIYRASSFFVNPNTFGLWLLIGLASLLCWVDNSIKKTIGLIIIYIGLFVAFSRGALLAVFIFLSIYNLLLKKYNILISIFCLAIFGYLIAEIFGLNSLIDSSNSRFSSSLNSRDVAWDMLLNSIVENPMLGVGFGVSNEIVLNIEELGFSSHNLHLQFAAETGLIGYFLFLIVYLYPILFCLQKIKIKEKIKENTFFFALLISIFFHQFFENTLFRSGFFTYFWFFISCIPFYINNCKKER